MAVHKQQSNINYNFFSPFSVGDYVFLKSNGPIEDGKRHKHDVMRFGTYQLARFKNQQAFTPVRASLASELNQQEERGEPMLFEPNSVVN